MNIREYASHLSNESKRLKKLIEFRKELSQKILLGLKIKDVKKSYNIDETQLYIFIQTDSGSINITLDLMERIE